MIKEIPIFKSGTYNKPSSLFHDIVIGSVQCVGHSVIKAIQYCVSYKEEKTYYLPILKEHTAIFQR